MELLPQEIETWYILPALRREFAEVLCKKYKMRQREIASILNVTEAAISQYKKNKRGVGVKFCGEMKKEIGKSAERVAKKTDSFQMELQKIFAFMRKEGHICDIHKKIDLKVSKKCNVCFCA